MPAETDNFKETVPPGYSKADADLNFSNYECIHKICTHSSQTDSQHRVEEGSYLIPELLFIW